MRPAFRWFGDSDRVSLSWIRQMTPAPAVVTHLTERKPGEIWSLEELKSLREKLRKHQLDLGPIESLFWSDAMKLGTRYRDTDISKYLTSLRNIRNVFPEHKEIIVTYNLMPLDWGRTNFKFRHPNGTLGLAYDDNELKKLDTGADIFLPGWGKPYSHHELTRLREAYEKLGEDGLWSNVEYVLKALIPECENLGIRLAAHPNDPPWSTFGLPALLTDEESISRLLNISKSTANSLCFCTGSFGASSVNNVYNLIEIFHKRMAWVHLRNVKITGDQCFHEIDHADPDGSCDLMLVVKLLVSFGWDGFFRSDHGLEKFYETDTKTVGYPLIDRYAANNLLWAYSRAFETKLKKD